MTTLLSDSELRLQTKARAFVDELIPHEVNAEMNGGKLPDDVEKTHHDRARELNLLSLNMPTSMGGPGYTMLEQAVIQEQTGRVTNALGWVVSTGPSWIEPVVTNYQLDRWIRPTVTGELHECYAITE
jgi:alkylation response protein AidB-like acyl-CoA dehydrogenase